MGHAVVIGASMSGLLSAAALHRLFARVTVLDRDTLPTADAHRRGVAQSRHAHGLLARGREVMDELLPGITAELVAQGAISGDLQRHARHVHGGLRHARGDSGLNGLLVSRPLLEGQVRRRVTGLPGVRVLPNRIVTGLLSQAGRVTGARLAGGEPIPADLVVDASGRGSRTPHWLGELGYQPPREDRVTIDLRYGTREFRRGRDHLDGDVVVVIAPTPGRPRGGVALALELLDLDLRPLPYFKRISQIVNTPWEITVGADLLMPGVEGGPSAKTRMMQAYLDRFHAAAVHDPELVRRFLRVTNLYDAPPSLMSPGALLRVLRSGGQRAVPVPA